MLQNPCKTLGFKKNMVYEIPPGGEVNHIQPVAYILYSDLCGSFSFTRVVCAFTFCRIMLTGNLKGGLQIHPFPQQNFVHYIF